MTPASILSLHDVSVAHPQDPGRALLRGVNWKVGAGECWVVTGLHGSGKTALLETVAGLHGVMGGELRVFGQVLAEGDSASQTALRRRCGFVFEGPGRLFPGLSVLENISLPVRYHQNLSPEEAMKSVTDLLTTLDLESVASHHPGRLSRAWARRVALARALALRPELLLLDNPLAGLDPSHVRWWRTLLGEFVAGHPLFDGVPRTILIASDELRSLLPLGRHFAVARDGHFVELGDRHAVETSADPLVQDLLNEED